MFRPHEPESHARVRQHIAIVQIEGLVQPQGLIDLD
jgi:hypothetical protein